MTWRPKVLALAPYCDLTDVGEAWCAAKWVEELALRADVTLLAMERPGRKTLQGQLPGVKVMTMAEPAWCRRHERLNAMAKLSYPAFYRWAKKEIRALLAAGQEFDIGHQFAPIALRFPSPLAAFDIPFVLGPQGGSLDTPAAFQAECASGRWYMGLRNIDNWRLRFDPLLRHTYRRASMLLGVAPYVKDLIPSLDLPRFAVESELGVERLMPPNSPFQQPRPTLRLLHVGRGVRTKGLRDVIRAMAYLKDISVHLDVAGKGEEMQHCREMANALGLTGKVTFHGQISRSAVDALYRQADVFCFPSFREPSGSVVYEALSFGLPVIAADRGGPGHVVDDSCGFKVPITSPDAFAADIASAIRTLHAMPALRARLGEGALERMQSIALWPQKIDRLITYYAEICVSRVHGKETTEPCPTTHNVNAC
ncbi:MAG: glycosyltransferase family 4 protein [Alphaproteobacteria bacterium]|nr:glycosyltransferase family 4 protein [Alphaproteobacteria bacterium]